MSCIYCKEDYALINTTSKMSTKGDFYPGIVAGIDNRELYFASDADTYEPSHLEAFCKINFCPMCGCKLEV